MEIKFMKNQTCCFTGHRIIPASEYHEIQKSLEDEISNLVQQGVRYFGAGDALGFDTLAALTVLSLKKEYPQIKLILVFPCLTQTKGWAKKDIEIYKDIQARCDKYVYASQEYTLDYMYKRNRHLVDNSGFCICYLSKAVGGTAYTVDYARRKGLRIINLAQP